MAISEKQRRWLLGIALLLTLAATAAVSRDDDEASASVVAVAADRHAHRHETRAEDDNGVSSSVLMLDRLKRPALPENDVKDMFKAKSWYTPPPATVARAAAVAAAKHTAAPPLPFTYIGKMQVQGGGYMVFLAKQNRVYTIREGDKVDGNYRVDSIKAPVMTLTYLPLDIKQTLQIGEAN